MQFSSAVSTSKQLKWLLAGTSDCLSSAVGRGSHIKETAVHEIPGSIPGLGKKFVPNFKCQSEVWNLAFLLRGLCLKLAASLFLLKIEIFICSQLLLKVNYYTRSLCVIKYLLSVLLSTYALRAVIPTFIEMLALQA